MQISKNKVVSINYTLKNNDGIVIDSNEGKQPLMYLQGNGNLIIGLEEELEGKTTGDKLEVSIAPEKGYGVRDENLIQQVPMTAFGGQKVEAGMQFTAESQHGMQVVTITEVEAEHVKVDANHPLAGETLHFSVEVLDIREATSEEVDHGHVHGPGGHQHD